jgi:hypothetical protein
VLKKERSRDNVAREMQCSASRPENKPEGEGNSLAFQPEQDQLFSEEPVPICRVGLDQDVAGLH